MFQIYDAARMSGLSLLCAHSGLNNINHIVAQLLTLAYNVHIHRAYGVGVFVAVHVVDILALQLVAVVVNLVLYVERAVDVELVLAP